MLLLRFAIIELCMKTDKYWKKEKRKKKESTKKKEKKRKEKNMKKAFKHGDCLYKEPWTGRAVSHLTLDVDPSTS